MGTASIGFGIRVPLLALVLLAAAGGFGGAYSVTRTFAHPPGIYCGPNIGGNASFYYTETWCTGYAYFMTANAALYKYDGVDYILRNSTSGACYGPPEPHVCAWTNATGSNGYGAGYYAVEGGHGVYHGNTLTFPSYIEFTVF